MLRSFRDAVGVLLWAVAPICVVYGGLAGLFGALLVGGAGSHLLRLHHRRLPVSASGPR